MPQITVHRLLGLNPSWVQSAPLMGPACAHLDLNRSCCERLYAGSSKSDALIQLRGYFLVTHENESSVAACTCSARAKTAYMHFKIIRFMLRRTTMRTIVGLDHVHFHTAHTTSDIYDGARPVLGTCDRHPLADPFAISDKLHDLEQRNLTHWYQTTGHSEQ